jgi:hypothetical protein
MKGYLMMENYTSQSLNNQYHRSDNLDSIDNLGNTSTVGSTNDMMSYVKILHASPNAPAVDIYVNDNKVIENLAFSEATDYTPINPGSYNVKVYATGTTTNPIIDVNAQVPEKTRLTVAIIGNPPNVRLLPIPENIVPKISNDTHLRVAHLSPSAPAVDITLQNGDVIFENVEFGEVTDYISMPRGVYTLQIRPTGSSEVVMTISNVEFMPNFYYTIYILGQLQGTPALQVFATANRTPGILTSKFNEQYYPLTYEVSKNTNMTRGSKDVNMIVHDFRKKHHNIYDELEDFGLDKKIIDYLVKTMFMHVHKHHHKYSGNTRRKANIASRDISLLCPWIFDIMAALDIPGKKVVDITIIIVSYGFDNLEDMPSSLCETD